MKWKDLEKLTPENIDEALRWYSKVSITVSKHPLTFLKWYVRTFRKEAAWIKMLHGGIITATVLLVLVNHGVLKI